MDDAIRIANKAKKNEEALSIGLLGNAAEIFPKFLEKNIIPEIVTDQTSAHDELIGYIPNGIKYSEALALRESDSNEYIKRS